ncbi:MAG: nucleotidyltransferase family protein [Patescibacteria group bacterium]
MQQTLSSLKKTIPPILKKHGVIKADLFGSYARGDAKKGSDVDILVSLKKSSSLLDLIALQQELEEVLNNKVDVVTYRSIHPLLRKSIMRDREYLYG